MHSACINVDCQSQQQKAQMNIEKFKHQHVDILSGIAELRRLTQLGITEHAHTIAARLVALSSVVRLHLAGEARGLYPTVEAAVDQQLRDMSRAYRGEMEGIANTYLRFVALWRTGAQIRNDPEGFRAAANAALRQVHDRMQRENREFYPAIERVTVAAPA